MVIMISPIEVGRSNDTQTLTLVSDHNFKFVQMIIVKKRSFAKMIMNICGNSDVD